MGSKSLSDYEIYDEIGRGRHSIVYRGRRRFSLDYVAVKSMERSHSKRLMNQVSVLSKVQTQENIMRFHTWYQTPNHVWACFEYCAGGIALFHSYSREL